MENTPKSESAQLEELKKSNASLQQFAYIASHDLQEPLRTITSFAQLISKRFKGKLDPEADEFIDFIIDGAARMKQLTADILAFSQVDVLPNPDSIVDLKVTLEQAIQNIKASAEEVNAKISFDPLPVIKGEPIQFVQVFQNLLSNSIKYRSPNRPLEIHVGSTTEKGSVKVSVKDNGIGIDNNHLEKIFIMFKRLHGREIPGTGMGLAISKKIIERHGGKIWAESTPGLGATFIFTTNVLTKQISRTSV